MRLSLFLVLVACSTAGVAAAAGSLVQSAPVAGAFDALHVTTATATATSSVGSALSASVPDRLVAPPVDSTHPDATVAFAQRAPSTVALRPMAAPPAEAPFPLLPDDSALAGTTASEPVLFPARALAGLGVQTPAVTRRHALDINDGSSLGDTGSSSDATTGVVPHATSGAGSTTTQSAGARAVAPPPGFGQHARAVAAGGALALTALVLGGMALYHRVRPATALDNETRKSIFDAVCATPGLGVHAIAAQAGVSYSTATYHLERLVAAGMIVMTPDGNKLCYYKNGGAFTEAERRILPILKNDEATKLLEAILENPGTYRAALAERLGVTATTINWHLKRLREANLVQESRQGRNAYLYANGLALQQSLPTLAQKLATTDVAVAERIARYLGQTSASGPVASS